MEPTKPRTRLMTVQQAADELAVSRWSVYRRHCCVGGKRVWLIGVVPRSDGEGEFGKGRWEAMLWVEFHAEFVVAAADVLDECVSGTDHAGRAEPFEATHWPQSGLESSMIGLDRIISVLLHNMARGRQQLIEHPRVGRCPVGAQLARA